MPTCRNTQIVQPFNHAFQVALRCVERILQISSNRCRASHSELWAAVGDVAAEESMACHL